MDYTIPPPQLYNIILEVPNLGASFLPPNKWPQPSNPSAVLTAAEGKDGQGAAGAEPGRALYSLGKFQPKV